MKFNLLSLTPVSACFELDNHAIYAAPEPYEVSLNGQVVLKGQERNVFSLYGLQDDTDYTVAIGQDSLTIHTPKASMILHLKDFPKAAEGDDTLRVQMAISCLPEKGVLVFDEAEYHLTSVFLKSQITLVIPKGTVVYGNPELKDYPFMPGEYPYAHKKLPAQLLSWEGNPFVGMPSLFSAFHAQDIAIVGEGKIDGQASVSHFWDDVKHLKWARPNLLYFNDCHGVTLMGLEIGNSPSWTIHPYFCQGVGFYDLSISNPKDSPNTDGMDPECCSDVKAIGIRFSVGDDCIALKSGKIYIGSTYKQPCEHVVIRNCYMHEGHGAIVLGSEAGAGVRDLAVERCLFEGTDRGLRIKSRRGRGQDDVIDGIKFSYIKMINVLTPLAASMYYFCDPDGKDPAVQDKAPHPVDATTPYLGAFEFDHLDCSGAEVCLGIFYGLPERKIGSITIRDSRFAMKPNAKAGMPAMMCDIAMMHNAGFLFVNVEKVTLENLTCSGYEGAEATYTNVASVKSS